MLDFKRLQYLDAVYQYKSFTRASEALFVSQPAISTAIHALEKEMGVRLIDRTSKGVAFTLEGEQFMTAVSRILRECAEAETLAIELSDSQESILSVGFSPTLNPQLLPHLYKNFFPQWPKARIRVGEFSLWNCIERIQNDQMDLAYNALPDLENHPTLKMLPVTTSEICTVLTPDHPLARYERIPIEALDGVAVAMLDETALIRSRMLRLFKEKGVFPKIISQHEQIIGMLHMVEFGNCVCFLNKNCGSLVANQSLCVRPFADPIPIEGGFVMKEDKRLSKMSQALINFAAKTLDEWDEQM